MPLKPRTKSQTPGPAPHPACPAQTAPRARAPQGRPCPQRCRRPWERPASGSSLPPGGARAARGPLHPSGSPSTCRLHEGPSLKPPLPFSEPRVPFNIIPKALTLGWQSGSSRARIGDIFACSTIKNLKLRRFQINLEVAGLLKFWKVCPQMYISLKQYWAVAKKCLPTFLLSLRTQAISTAFVHYHYSPSVRKTPRFTSYCFSPTPEPRRRYFSCL